MSEERPGFEEAEENDVPAEANDVQEPPTNEPVADEPTGTDNIREGNVRGTMFGGQTKSGGQGQGG